MCCITASISIFSSFTQADFFGKLIYITLFILSIFSWILMIYKIKITKIIKRKSFHFEDFFQQKKDIFLNIDLSKIEPSFNPYLNIYKSIKVKAFELLNKNKYFAEKNNQKEVFLSRSDIDLVEAETASKIIKEKKLLEKNLFILSTIVTIAPFLGLLGTVWGILITFSNLETAGFASANSAVLTGLAMALGTTVFGLLVAIPALIGYNYLKASMKDYTDEMEGFAHSLISFLEIQYRKA